MFGLELMVVRSVVLSVKITATLAELDTKARGWSSHGHEVQDVDR